MANGGLQEHLYPSGGMFHSVYNRKLVILLQLMNQAKGTPAMSVDSLFIMLTKVVQ